MKIELEFVSFLDLPEEKNNSTLKLEDNLTVREVLEELGLSRQRMRHIKPFINQEEKDLGAQLQDGDDLFLYLPAGGGDFIS